MGAFLGFFRTRVVRRTGMHIITTCIGHWLTFITLRCSALHYYYRCSANRFAASLNVFGRNLMAASVWFQLNQRATNGKESIEKLPLISLCYSLSVISEKAPLLTNNCLTPIMLFAWCCRWSIIDREFTGGTTRCIVLVHFLFIFIVVPCCTFLIGGECYYFYHQTVQEYPQVVSIINQQ